MKRTRRLAGLAISGLLAVLVVGCTPSHPQSTFDTLGPVAESQVVLFWWIFWAAVIVFVAVMGVLVYTVIRFRARPGDVDPPQIHGHRGLEITWSIVPAIVLIPVAIVTVITIFDNANSPEPPEEGGLEVVAIAHQWWFEFKYPQHDVVTANELHIPVGRPVNIALDSRDVIHSFWVPKLAGKVDMVPNNDNEIWMEADEVGLYYGQCAEFCGVSHANMRFKVIAQEQAEFDKWLQEQAPDAALPEAYPLAMKGHELFMSRQANCFSCHTISGTERARGDKGPDLTHFASRGTFAGSTMDNTQVNLRHWLENPENMKVGNLMARDATVFNDPDDKLGEDQIAALVAYLRTLK